MSCNKCPILLPLEITLILDLRRCFWMRNVTSNSKWSLFSSRSPSGRLLMFVFDLGKLRLIWLFIYILGWFYFILPITDIGSILEIFLGNTFHKLLFTSFTVYGLYIPLKTHLPYEPAIPFLIFIWRKCKH